MPAFSSSLSLGSPRFSDARLANAQGPLAASHEALATDARKVATGDFSVGLHLPGARTFLTLERLAIRTLRYRVGKGQLLFAARADELADASAKIDP